MPMCAFALLWERTINAANVLFPSRGRPQQSIAARLTLLGLRLCHLTHDAKLQPTQIQQIVFGVAGSACRVCDFLKQMCIVYIVHPNRLLTAIDSPVRP